MKQVVATAAAKAAVAAAAATGGGTQRMAVVNHEPQPQHKLFNDRHLQDAVDTSTVSIGGAAFFDVNGNGQLNLDQGDGSINPISNTAISVLAELWSCDNGQNLGYQLTDASGNYVFTVPAEPGRACYYVRFDTSSMEGTFSCSGQPKCATDNLMLSAEQEALDIDVGIQSSDFDALVAALEEDIVDEDPVTDDGDGWSISGGLVFEPMTYQPTYVIPSRPSPAVSTPPPTFATFVPDTPSPSVKETTLIPTNSPSAGSITEEPPEDNDDTEQQATSSSGLIQLNSQIRVMLSNIESPMEDNSKELFEDVCDTFLNEQLAIAVPPVSYIKCTVVDQSVESGRRRRLRNLEQVERLLGSTLAVEVVVTGVALPTNTIKTQEQVKFQDKIAGTFTAQGDQFVRLLKKEEAKVVTDFNDATFPTLDRVWVVKIMDAAGGVMTSNENDGSSIGLIAAIAAGGAVLLLLAIFLVVRFRSQKRKQQDLKAIGSNETESSLSPNNGSRLPNNTIGYFSTPVLSSSGIEVDHRDVSPTDMASRVQRDVMCPPGKLRILIANTQGYGPAIHTIKPNSPVEGLLFVGDIIFAVNDTNTRNSRADEITRLLKVTVREERKITVLSLRR
eukprot:scaffold15786_cov130-Skeletonema_marinoi.AAC.1